MKTQVIQLNDLETKKQIVNKAIRICVDCGNVSVNIENYGIFCKECGRFFDVKDDKI
ncbi:MAG: hypothetical protein OEQ12_07065 [Nitrosopumilus sp.]|nr:hypothetical protein [Nitrosopumilus sp.]